MLGMRGHLGNIALHSQAFPGIVARDAGTTWVNGAGRAGPLKSIPLSSKANCSEAMGQDCGEQSLGKHDVLRLAVG